MSVTPAPSFSLLGCTCGQEKERSGKLDVNGGERIIGGVPAIVNQYPWIVSIKIDKDNDGEVDFAEFQKWWGGNKTRAQVMSRVAMQMDRDKANKVEQEPGPPAAVYIGAAAAFTVITVLPTVYNVLTQIEELVDEGSTQ